MNGPMTPKRLTEIKRMLAKTYPAPSEMIDAREAAKELVAEVERLRRQLSATEREADRLRHGVPLEADYICPDSLRAHDAQKEIDRLRPLAFRWETVADYLGMSRTPREWPLGSLAVSQIGEWKRRTEEAEADRDGLKAEFDRLRRDVEMWRMKYVLRRQGYGEEIDRMRPVVEAACAFRDVRHPDTVEMAANLRDALDAAVDAYRESKPDKADDPLDTGLPIRVGDVWRHPAYGEREVLDAHGRGVWRMDPRTQIDLYLHECVLEQGEWTFVRRGSSVAKSNRGDNAATEGKE